MNERIVVHTFKGDGVLPGVDINNNAALQDLMDEDYYASLGENDGGEEQ